MFSRARLLGIVFTFLFASAASAEDLRLEVDLSTRQLSAWAGPNIVHSYRVAVGSDEKPTPTGTFKIRKLIWNPGWVPPDEKWARGKDPKDPGDPDNPMKRVKIFFQEPDYYIHGTADKDSMGKAESHGCVRMTPSEVTELAKLVMTYGGKSMPEPWYRRILHRRTTKVIYLEKPIVIHIAK